MYVDLHTLYNSSASFVQTIKERSNSGERTLFWSPGQSSRYPHSVVERVDNDEPNSPMGRPIVAIPPT
ncbi:hypothetical protein CDAR_497291 [Caerostris darwini]|uniref:Uncharacterized protein n=1 Tax=Caerostris darwini TaxID=1538125 RepID=A0AAV4S082_9ARAC|nr:hypothetical protein CDAR_497291 [Caerostris darwini]